MQERTVVVYISAAGVSGDPHKLLVGRCLKTGATIRAFYNSDPMPLFFSEFFARRSWNAAFKKIKQRFPEGTKFECFDDWMEALMYIRREGK